MTEFYVKRVGNAIHPVDDESLLALAAVPFGKTLRCEVKQPRSIQHHRLYFALCARIASGVGSTTDNVSDLFKIATGHCTLVKTKSYGELRLPKSISFSSMDQIAFAAFFESCIQTAYNEFGIDPADIADLLVPEEAQKHG